MARLPKLPYRLTRSRPTQLAFGGLNHTATAADGEIYDERDVSTDEYPALVPRKPRLRSVAPIGTQASKIGSDGARLFWCCGQSFYYDGKKVLDLPLTANTERLFACLGEQIVIFPDGVIYNSETGSGSTLTARIAANATVGREHAQNRQVLSTTTAEADFSSMFSVGDLVKLRFSATSLADLDGAYTIKSVSKKTITLAEGSLSRVGIKGIAEVYTAPGTDGAVKSQSVYLTVHSEYEVNRDTLTFDTSEDLTVIFSPGDAIQLNNNLNKSYVIDSVSAQTLFFAEHTLEGIAEIGTTMLSCIAERRLPIMDQVCVSGNRVFGCRGSEIFACKQGDPSNWYYYHAPSLSTDSWYLDTGDPSPFTACCVYGGRPHFFTERSVTVLYGDTPAQFSTATAALDGVKAGSRDSLVEVDGALYYLSHHGIVRYTSSDGAQVISDALGVAIDSAVAGTDGRCYYVCTKDIYGSLRNYKLSLKSGLWAKEDDREFLSFAAHEGRLFALSSEEQGIYVLTVSGGYVIGGETIGNLGGFMPLDYPSMEVILAPLREDRSEGTALRSRWVQKLYLRMIRSPDTEVSVSVLFDSGEEREVMRRHGIVPLYEVPEAVLDQEEIVQIPLPNNRCDTYRIIIRAQNPRGAAVKLLGLTREHYSIR